MSEKTDMATPVTHGEMRQAFDTWGRIFMERFDELAAEMRALVRASEQRIMDHINAIMEPHDSIPERMNRIEEQALPERVSKLEAKVFAPKRRATAGRRRRS